MMRSLQVSFSRGNVLTLHNLELDLAPLLGGAAALAHVRRAFARRLSITIPWTALTTQPIQVGRPSPCAGLQRLAAWQGIAAGNTVLQLPGQAGCGQAWGVDKHGVHPGLLSTQLASVYQIHQVPRQMLTHCCTIWPAGLLPLPTGGARHCRARAVGGRAHAGTHPVRLRLGPV